MRRTFGIGLTIAVLALGCGTKPGPSAPSGPAGIEGGWTLIGVEIEGKKATEADLAKQPLEERKIKATGDKLIAKKDGADDITAYKIDRSKTPNEIDLTETKDGKAVTTYGICKLEGDVLTICGVESNKPADRPKEFKTAPGSKAMILTLKKD